MQVPRVWWALALAVNVYQLGLTHETWLDGEAVGMKEHAASPAASHASAEVAWLATCGWVLKAPTSHMDAASMGYVVKPGACQPASAEITACTDRTKHAGCIAAMSGANGNDARRPEQVKAKAAENH